MKALLLVAVWFGCPQDEPPKPTEHHKHLAMEVGTWEASGKMFVGPEPMTFSGAETNVLICNGLWLESNFSGWINQLGGFRGHGVNGYDTQKKKYVGMWVDSMSTQLGKLEGTCSKDGKVRTLFSTGPGPGGKNVRWKQVTEFTDKDHKTFLVYRQDPKQDPKAPEVKWIKAVEIKYTRAKRKR